MIIVVVLNNTNINVIIINVSNDILLLVLLSEATGVTIILVYNIYIDEDQSYIKRYLINASITNNIINRVLNNNNYIILLIIYQFKKNYFTVIQEQQQIIFDTLIQEFNLVKNYYRKINKYISQI